MVSSESSNSFGMTVDNFLSEAAILIFEGKMEFLRVIDNLLKQDRSNLSLSKKNPNYNKSHIELHDTWKRAPSDHQC